MIAIISAPFPRKAGKLLVVDAVFGLYMLDLEKVTFDAIIHHDHQMIKIIQMLIISMIMMIRRLRRTASVPPSSLRELNTPNSCLLTWRSMGKFTRWWWLWKWRWWWWWWWQWWWSNWIELPKCESAGLQLDCFGFGWSDGLLDRLQHQIRPQWWRFWGGNSIKNQSFWLETLIVTMFSLKIVSDGSGRLVAYNLSTKKVKFLWST